MADMERVFRRVVREEKEADLAAKEKAETEAHRDATARLTAGEEGMDLNMHGINNTESHVMGNYRWDKVLRKGLCEADWLPLRIPQAILKDWFISVLYIL